MTVAVDLNVKQLAVITVRQHGKIIQTRFVSDEGLDQHRYQHLKQVTKKQWPSGKPVKGEHSNHHLWTHIRRQNLDTAHKTARAIVKVCEQYAGCVLLFERLRKLKPKGGGKSRRLNRKQANQLKGKINQLTKEKAYAGGVVSVEVNAHGTSQYCARCGGIGVRFTSQAAERVTGKGGKLFFCSSCHYEGLADFNASVNVHHSFFREYHWQQLSTVITAERLVWLYVRREMVGEDKPSDPAQARSLICEHVKVVGLLLVQRGHVPICKLFRTSPQNITYWIAAETPLSWTV